MPEPYTTRRFQLRAIADADLPELHRNFSDDALMRYYDGAPLRSLAEVEDLLQRWRRRERKGTGLRWAIVTRDGGRFVGTCGLHDIHVASGCAELGCEVGRAFWGRGVMQEVAPVVGRHAFEKLELKRLNALIAPGNRASVRLIESLGFRKRRVMHDRRVVNGRRSDMLDYTMTRAAYFALVRPGFATRIAAIPMTVRESIARLVYQLQGMDLPRT